jgi:gliding motility-associated-like protein
LNPAITGATFTWTGNGLPDTKIGDSVFFKTLENPTIYNLTVKTPQGCMATINNIQVKVEVPEYDFPNVFYPESPNAPDNRTFDIVLKKGNRTSITMRTLKIFNRWGQLVYNNDNPGGGWDGRIDGTYAASEVYTYFAEFELASGSVIARKGEVLLLR